MNKVVLMGRLTRDPDIRWSQGQDQQCTARYTLAVDRRVKRDAPVTADFIPCVAFGKTGEWAEKWLKKGMKVAISGRIQTGKYVNRDGITVYTTDVVIEEQEFAESKREQEASNYAETHTGQTEIREETRGNTQEAVRNNEMDGFMNIPDEIDEELPFT